MSADTGQSLRFITPRARAGAETELGHLFASVPRLDKDEVSPIYSLGLIRYPQRPFIFQLHNSYKPPFPPLHFLERVTNIQMTPLRHNNFLQLHIVAQSFL